MKYFILSFLLLTITFYTHAQQNSFGQVTVEFNKEKKKSKAIAKVELKGAFESDTTWRSILENQINASRTIGKGAKKGKYIVVIHYILAKDSTISDVTCINDPGYGMGEASIGAVKKGPARMAVNRWAPVRQYRKEE